MECKRIITWWLLIALPLIIMGFLYCCALVALVGQGSEGGTCLSVIKIIGACVLSLVYLLGGALLWRYVMECIKTERMRENTTSNE